MKEVLPVVLKEDACEKRMMKKNDEASWFFISNEE
jgi:hypothetical protein